MVPPQKSRRDTYPVCALLKAPRVHDSHAALAFRITTLTTSPFLSVSVQRQGAAA